MFVVSSNSLGRFAADTPRRERRSGAPSGIDFLLDGTIQRVRNRLRITMRLLDLRAGNQVVWARRFDRQTHDLLSLQDEIAAEVVAQIDPEILLIEAKRVAAPPADRRHRLRFGAARPAADRPHGARPFMQAGELPSQAIALEPDYAAAHAWYAYWHIFLVGQGWARGRRDGADHRRAARRAGGDARPVRRPRADHRRPRPRLPESEC